MCSRGSVGAFDVFALESMVAKHANILACLVICLSRINGVARTLQKVTHIKGRLLDQAKRLFNCVPFQMGTSLKGKNLLPEGANSFLYEQFFIVWKITFTILSDLH